MVSRLTPSYQCSRGWTLLKTMPECHKTLITRVDETTWAPDLAVGPGVREWLSWLGAVQLALLIVGDPLCDPQADGDLV